MFTRTCPIAHPLHVHAASGHTKHPCCKHPLYELLQGQALLLSQETSLLVLGPHLRVGQEASCDCFHDAVLQLLCIVRDNQLHRHVGAPPLSLHWEGSSAGQSDRKRVTTRRRECHACRYCSLPTSAAVAVAAAGTVALLLHSTSQQLLGSHLVHNAAATTPDEREIAQVLLEQVHCAGAVVLVHILQELGQHV